MATGRIRHALAPRFPLPRTLRAAREMSRRGRCSLALLLAASLAPAADAAAPDPARTVTIYVHGFELTGADRSGAFGQDIRLSVAENVAGLIGLPVNEARSAGPIAPNAVAATTYYGSQPPAYYTADDRAELARITADWGGGVPRYAFIVARHARWILERSGALRVNFVSASFGSLIVRWMIEKNVGGLAWDGRIARWLTVEGVVSGNWVASHDGLVRLLSYAAPEPIDVRHMDYRWVETYLHAPRTEAASPYYGGILIGQVASTDDGGLGAPLREAMLANGEYQPNDQVQGLMDATFSTSTPSARFEGKPPTRALFHATHTGIQGMRGAWAEAATFLTANRRVTVTMTTARVNDLNEVMLPFWSWAPAEVVFEAQVYSPAVAARWGILDPVSAQIRDGAAVPIERFRRGGETRTIQHVLFDDLVLPEETELRLDLRASEVDYDPRYSVYETAQQPYYDDMGSGTLTVSTREPGTYTFAAGEWSCEVAVDVFDYPAALQPRQPKIPRLPAVPREEVSLVITPNPSRSEVRIVAPAAASTAGPATLEVSDVSGRIVRLMTGVAGEGFAWNGRDEGGRELGAGVYFYRVVTAGRTWTGRSALVR
jgi:hypothetical protein